jgi:hypothetical protein
MVDLVLQQIFPNVLVTLVTQYANTSSFALYASIPHANENIHFFCQYYDDLKSILKNTFILFSWNQTTIFSPDSCVCQFTTFCHKKNIVLNVVPNFVVSQAAGESWDRLNAIVLFDAIQRGLIDFCHDLVANCPALLDCSICESLDHYGSLRPLMVAIAAEQPDVVRVFLEIASKATKVENMFYYSTYKPNHSSTYIFTLLDMAVQVGCYDSFLQLTTAYKTCSLEEFNWVRAKAGCKNVEGANAIKLRIEKIENKNHGVG